MYQPWGHIKFINPRAYQPSELYIFGMALVHKTGTSRMVDHTLIDVPLARVTARTSGGNKDKDNDDNQCGAIPAWMFRRPNQKTGKSAPKERDSKKKPAQPKENDDRARQNVKVKEGATEEKCVAGPVVMRAQAKKSDKVHPLKVKKAMSSVDKSTIENLQRKDSTLKKCFDRIGKPIIRENYVGEFYKKNGLLYRKHQETKTGRSFNQLFIPKELGDVSEP